MKLILKKIFEEATFFGGLGFYAFLIILFFVIGKTNYSIKLFLSLIIIYFLTFIIRLFYFKSRPKKEEYRNFLEKIDASSFPSVHAARATFLCFFSILVLNLTLYVNILIFVLFFLVLYSRIYLKKHYLIDVIGGVILGIISLISLIII